MQLHFINFSSGRKTLWQIRQVNKNFSRNQERCTSQYNLRHSTSFTCLSCCIEGRLKYWKRRSLSLKPGSESHSRRDDSFNLRLSFVVGSVKLLFLIWSFVCNWIFSSDDREVLGLLCKELLQLRWLSENCKKQIIKKIKTKRFLNHEVWKYQALGSNFSTKNNKQKLPNHLAAYDKFIIFIFFFLVVQILLAQSANQQINERESLK